MSKIITPRYFRNLNGLRFIAALLVASVHTEQIKWLLELANHWDMPLLHSLGKIGVVLFFVLSGFLITYLLLDEKESNGRIGIRLFYLRRIFRIWPLYFLVIILGFFVLPHIEFFYIPSLSSALFDYYYVKLTLFVLFLPFVAQALFAPVPSVSQAWSIGVEEQFYIIWPLLLTRTKRPLRSLIAITIFYNGAKLLLIILQALSVKAIPTGILLQITDNFCIDCMAIGSIAAILFRKKSPVLKVLYSQYTQYACYLTILIITAFNLCLPHLYYSYFSLLFAIIILNLGTNPNSILKLEFPVLSYLGKTSYSMYMLHPIAIYTFVRLDAGFLPPMLTYFCCIGLTIILAIASYELLEKPFLRYKESLH